MTLAHIATGAGVAFCILIGLFFAVLVIGKQTKPTGAHHARHDDEDYWQHIREMPDRHGTPPHPDGGTAP